MWFWLSLICLLCWSGSDLFSKMGCSDTRDRYNYLKMVTAVGVVMGIHACYEIFIGGTVITWGIVWTYLPVSLLYIGSMTLGYMGLRYIELSISSPICNASGALVAIMAIVTDGIGDLNAFVLAAVVITSVGVIGIGFVEANEDEELRMQRQSRGNYQYAKSWIAIALPLAYCLLDAIGTFADNRVLEVLDEGSANVAYELTFLVAGALCFFYVVVVKKDRLTVREEAPKYAGAIFETAGQFAYIYAIADTGHLVLSASMISAYCVVSMVWSRIFLKEQLSWKHYLMLALVVIGIVIMGIFDV